MQILDELNGFGSKFLAIFNADRLGNRDFGHGRLGGRTSIEMKSRGMQLKILEASSMLTRFGPRAPTEKFQRQLGFQLLAPNVTTRSNFFCHFNEKLSFLSLFWDRKYAIESKII
jgi:hypothetical protein